MNPDARLTLPALFGDVVAIDPDWPALEDRYGTTFTRDLRRFRDRVARDVHRARKDEE